MKTVKSLLVMTFLSAALAACSKGGGGGGATASTPGDTTGALGLCTMDANGYCTGGTMASIEVAQWNGTATITDMTNYQLFLSNIGYCNRYGYGVGCPIAQVLPTLQVSIQTLPNAVGYSYGYGYTTLPGYSKVILSTQSSAAIPRNFRISSAHTVSNTSNNGLLIDYRTAQQIATLPYPTAPAPITYSANALFEIGTVFTAADHSTMSFQLFYNGVQIGSGTLTKYALGTPFQNVIQGTTTINAAPPIVNYGVSNAGTVYIQDQDTHYTWGYDQGRYGFWYGRQFHAYDRTNHRPFDYNRYDYGRSGSGCGGVSFQSGGLSFGLSGCQ